MATTNLRRSSRLQSSAPTQQPSVGASSSNPPKRPAKRQRVAKDDTETKAVSRSKRVTKKQVLRQMLDMPLDILYEVMGHLEPQDLLRLARTTKDFRAILFNRTSTSVWKKARSHIPSLPNCPENLSEPAYAHLLFDQYCDFCITARVLKPIWTCRLRVCKKCYKEQFMEVLTLFSYLPKGGFADKIHPALMVPVTRHRNSEYVAKMQVQAMCDRVAEVMQDEEQTMALEKNYTARARAMEEFGDELEEWADEQSLTRTLELHGKRMQRQLDICSRLAEHGLAGEIPMMSHAEVERLTEQNFMTKAQDLTDRVWENMKDEVIGYFQNVRARRLAVERCERIRDSIELLEPYLRDFYASRPASEVLPHIADFCYMPPIRDFLEVWDDPVEDVDFLEHLPDRLLTLSKEWLESRQETLGGVMKLKEGTDAKTAISLATTWFAHRRGLLVQGTNILEEAALRRSRLDITTSTAHTDLLNALHVLNHQWPFVLNEDPVQFCNRSFDVVTKLVEICNKDPRTTTAQEMDDLNGRYACEMCIQDKRGKKYSMSPMSWRQVPAHIIQNHSSKPDFRQAVQSLRKLNDHDANVVKRQDNRSFIYQCKICRDPFSVVNVDRMPGPFTPSEVAHHLRDIHGWDANAEVVKGVDYRVDPMFQRSEHHTLAIVINGKVLDKMTSNFLKPYQKK